MASIEMISIHIIPVQRPINNIFIKLVLMI